MSCFTVPACRMIEATTSENKLELENLLEDASEEDAELLYMGDEYGKKQLIEVDRMKEVNERCHKTTYVLGYYLLAARNCALSLAVTLVTINVITLIKAATREHSARKKETY